MIHSDYHMHCSFSADSDSPMESMIEQSIARGLTSICFTDHQDWDIQYIDMDFTFDTEAYLPEFFRCREKYRDQIQVLLGVELGLQPHLRDRIRDYIAKYPFDFIIGSSHAAHGVDPYQKCFFEGRSEREAYLEYFTSIEENLQVHEGFQVYGHLDYAVRYGPNQNRDYSYEAYADVLDAILKQLIQKGIGIEINTSGFKYGLDQPHPHPGILKRYRELGGEIITVGSDAHCPEHIAYEFERAKQVLLAAGYRYYTVFRERKPEFVRLG